MSQAEDGELLERACEIFAEICDLEASEQESYLDALEDPALRAEVEGILLADRDSDSRLERRKARWIGNVSRVN